MSKKDTIKRLKFERKQVVSRLEGFNQFIISCDQLTNKITIKQRLSKCEALWDEFNKIHCELEFLEDSISNNERIDFENKYFETICMFKELINDDISANLNSSQLNSNASSNSVRLPPLDLPLFDGKYEKWTSFFDTFIALIHSNNSLTSVQKFYYLQSCLKGEAAQTISAIPATDLNYEIAFKLLRERYENKRLIVQSHLKSLFDMPNVGKNNHFELRKCLDTIQKNVRALKSLKEPIEHWDTILIYLFNLKLDLNTKKEWETYSIKNNSAKFSDFVNFLTERCQVLESVHSGTKIQDRVQDKAPKYSTSRSFVLNKDQSRDQCLLCGNGEHWFSNCSKFLDLTENQRINEIKKLHLCLNCLKPNHLSTKCTQSGCKKCGKPHHYLLHIDFSKLNKKESNCENTSQSKACLDQFSAHAATIEKDITSNKINAENNELLSVNTSLSAHSANSVSDSEILLSTAKVLVCDKDGKSHEVRALLDCGSQSNFISSDLVSRLNLITSEVNMSVVGVNSSVTKSNKVVNLTVQSRFCAFSISSQFFVLNKIANNLPSCPINKEALKIPANIFLADSSFNIPGSIDLLLGANIFYELLSTGQIRTADNMPILQKTKLGWIISGSVSVNSSKNNYSLNKENEVKCIQTVCSFSSNKVIQKQMEQFWAIDEVQPVRIMKKEEKECEDLFVRTTRHAEDGKFIVELPTSEGIENIGDSKEIAIQRFGKLERKLKNNEELRKYYIEFMTEYEKLGHMTLIPENEIESDNPIYYMPHHAVVKETSSTTKVRVVFDASAKTSKGMSLNNKLKCGPVIQDELYSILIRFREHSCVIGADIEKMYRQVWIKAEQRDLQRIVWRNNTNENLRHYRLNTVTYGTTPASFLAIRSLHMAAEEEQYNFPNACKHIKKNFYVDDLLTGASSVEEAMNLKEDISKVLRKSGFVLRKWVSNKKEVLSRKEESVEVKHYIVEERVTKTLGLVWNIQEDSLQYMVQVTRGLKATKRNILSVISSLFDPLGLIGPVIIRAKILMQKLWNENLNWDEPVSKELFNLWIQFYNELPDLNDLSIARHALVDKPSMIELHGFCDSSERAYGACIYLRSINNNGLISTNLLCAKSKVAPIKTLTLPRLELCGALLLSRLMNKTMESLNSEISKVYYWTDSKIVLSWLSVESANWNVFVAHRVAEIQQNSNIHNWQHIISEENPADLISRGCNPEKLISSKWWWYGPRWLSKNSKEWPSNETIEISECDIPEKRTVKQVFVSFQLEQDIFTKFSTLLKLQRVVAYCLRFYHNVNSQVNNKWSGSLSVYELEQSLTCLIKLSQHSTFSSEINNLISNKRISNNSKIIPLHPFLDKNNVLRVGGRLSKSLISFNHKHPVILDKNHILSKLIISHEHKRNLHMGPQNLLSNIRGRFWILGGINTVKKILRSCIICFRVKPKGINTIMGELPEQRLIPTKPFFNSGVDYAGPFNIKSSTLRNAKVLKAYLCIFVCFVTKAVHLEVVSDLTAESFLNALKRFISRRGKCKNIFSDCGTNFVGANHQLGEFFKLLKDQKCKDKLTEYLAHDGIKWNFIPARSPHFGGLWESHVKIAKYYLKRIVGNASLTFEELSTVFVQIEACMNSRPLSPLSNDPSDLSPLTPGHFLVGESLVAVAESDVRHIKCSRLNRYQYLKQLVQHFWDRWHKEYLCDLNKRSKWQRQISSNINVGDMVVLKDENLPPLKWVLGRVEAVYPGSDNVVRVVSVKTAKGSVKRAVAKICVLPVDLDV